VDLAGALLAEGIFLQTSLFAQKRFDRDVPNTRRLGDLLL
jgi:hypothetical protein